VSCDRGAASAGSSRFERSPSCRRVGLHPFGGPGRRLPQSVLVTVSGPRRGAVDSAQLGCAGQRKIQQTPLLGRKLTSLPLLSSAVRSGAALATSSSRRPCRRSTAAAGADDLYVTAHRGTTPGRQTDLHHHPLAPSGAHRAHQQLLAEYGRTTGAALNLVTARATTSPRRHPGLSRPAGLQSDAAGHQAALARQAAAGERLRLGPLVRDRAYWSVAAESRPEPRLVHHLSSGPRRHTGQFKRPSSSAAWSRSQLAPAPARPLRLRPLQRHQSPGRGGRRRPAERRAIFRRSTENAQLGDTAVLGSAAWNDARLVWEKGDPITQFSPVTPSTQYVGRARLDRRRSRAMPC